MLQLASVLSLEAEELYLSDVRAHLEQVMNQNSWLATLTSPNLLCRCGHEARFHHHGKSCTIYDSTARLVYCKCEEFREANSNQGDDMAKEKKQRKPKGEGRTPRLAGLVDSPLVIFMTTGGKEYKGTVLTSGMIKVDEKEFTSPSSAGSYILGNDKKGKPRQVDGWKSWTFNKDGERVALDTLRGSKSPLKAEEAKPKREKKAKSASAPKKASKPRAARAKKAKIASLKTNGAAVEHDIRDSDIPQNEASA
jgi:hypothetical protein